MKKLIFIIIALLCGMSIFATTYLVELGTTGSAAWTGGPQGATTVNLTTEAKTLNVWFNSVTFAQGDEVWIAAGTYVLDGTIVIQTADDVYYSVYGGFLGSETALAGRVKGTNPWDFANATILDGNGQYQLIQANGADYYDATSGRICTFDGLTLTNGNATVNGGAFAGEGAITIQNCKFINNLTTQKGGGLYVKGGQYTIVNGCLFSGNQSESDGAGAVVEGFRVSVLNSVFEFNKMTPVSGGNKGGGLCFQGGSGEGEFGELKNCIFEGNFSAGFGGGFSINGANSVSENCIVVNNVSTHTYGGNESAIFFINGVIKNATIANNVGGVYLQSNGIGRELINTIIFNNGNTTFRATHDVAVAFKNCAMDKDPLNISDQTTTWIVSNSVDLTSVSLPDIFASSTAFTGLPTTEAESIALINAEWKLTASSPCIDAGTATDSPETDLWGTPRPVGTGVDIGAHEYDGTTTDLGTKNTEQRYIIYSFDKKIEIRGLEAGRNVSVFDLTGGLVKQIVAKSSVSIDLSQGIYIVKIGNNVDKIIVR